MAILSFRESAAAARVSLSLLQLSTIELIAKSELFAGLSRSDCIQVANLARLREYSRNDYVFERGQPITSVLLIVSGSLKLTQPTFSGSEVILWLGGPGEAVGVLGIPSRSRYTCSAQIIAKCRGLLWDWRELDELLISSQIRVNIGRIMSSRITELEARFREVATEKVATRVGFALLRILDRVGKPCQGGVEVLLSREELAQLTGTTLFTVSRLLSRWSEQGIVEPRREAVLVRDPVRLLQICSEDD